MNTNKINAVAKFVQKFITASVKQALWCRTLPNEQPTRENIMRSIAWPTLEINSMDEINAIMDIVYPKLRKNGILAKLRGAEPAHQ